MPAYGCCSVKAATPRPHEDASSPGAAFATEAAPSPSTRTEATATWWIAEGVAEVKMRGNCMVVSPNVECETTWSAKSSYWILTRKKHPNPSFPVSIRKGALPDSDALLKPRASH